MMRQAIIEPIVVDRLIKALEPLIRRVVREEFERVVRKRADMFHLEPDMPIYDDLLEIRNRKKAEESKLYSHTEVWGE